MAEGKIQSLKKENEKKDAVIEKAESKVKKIKDIAKEKIKKAEEKAKEKDSIINNWSVCLVRAEEKKEISYQLLLK